MLSTQWLKVSAALQADLQLFSLTRVLQRLLPSLSNLLRTFRSQVEREHHPGLVIAMGGPIMAAINDPPNYFGPD